MKNGTKKSSAPRTAKSILAALVGLKEKYAAQSASVSFLTVLGLLSALIIQQEVNLSFFAGSFLMSVAVYFIFFKDIKRYKPAYINERKMVYLLGLLLISTLLTGRIFSFLNAGLSRGFGFPDSIAAMLGTPIPVGAMLVALIFDFHTALIFSLLISLLTGFGSIIHSSPCMFLLAVSLRPSALLGARSGRHS